MTGRPEGSTREAFRYESPREGKSAVEDLHSGVAGSSNSNSNCNTVLELGLQRA